MHRILDQAVKMNGEALAMRNLFTERLILPRRTLLGYAAFLRVTIERNWHWAFCITDSGN